MEIFLDCLPCMLRQALEASRIVTDNTELQEKIIAEAINVIANYKKYGYSPEMARAVHQVVKKLSGIYDPFKKIKERDIKTAKKVYPSLRDFLQQKRNDLYWALKIAATGNIIDSAINNNVNIEEENGYIEKELKKEFSICDIEIFQNKLKTSKRLLIIGDNAGETVFDRILAERLSDLDIIYSVRSEPIINDATIEDAFASGLNDYAKIISSGCSAPGIILKECSDEFLKAFADSDIIISKGQGNFESLSGIDKEVFFLLKAKCPMISQRLHVNLNEYVFKYQYY